MKNIVQTFIYSNDSETKRKMEFDDNLNMSQIIGTAISDLFRFDKLTRKGSTKIVWYNKTIHIKILYNNRLIIDTRNPKFEPYEKFLKYRNSSKSKREFVKILWHLCETQKIDSKIVKTESIKINGAITLINKIKTTKTKIVFNDYNDFEIAVLCAGMKSAEARHLSKDYFKKNCFTKEERMIAKEFVKEVHKKYGKDILDYCLTLPKKPFIITNAKRAFTQFDNIRKGSIGIVRITADSLELLLSYNKDSDAIIIKNENENNIAEFKRTGEFSFVRNIKKPISSLVLFLSYIDDPLRQILYFGAKTGNCSFCGLSLTDPISLQYGYGKKCAHNHKLPWGWF